MPLRGWVHTPCCSVNIKVEFMDFTLKYESHTCPKCDKTWGCKVIPFCMVPATDPYRTNKMVEWYEYPQNQGVTS